MDHYVLLKFRNMVQTLGMTSLKCQQQNIYADSRVLDLYSWLSEFALHRSHYLMNIHILRKWVFYLHFYFNPKITMTWEVCKGYGGVVRPT